MTRLLWENLAILQEIHSATMSMTLKSSLTGIPLPLHAGALRYYEEQGVSIPESLRDD